MLKRRSKRRIPLLKHPGDPEPEYGSPGSIEQQLDMVEDGDLRGDEVIRRVNDMPTPDDPLSEAPADLLSEFHSMNLTLSERDREGDEMSGDDHSSGLQGGDFEMKGQRTLDTGIPGDDFERDSFLDQVIFLEEERRKRKLTSQRTQKKSSVRTKPTA